MNIHFIAITASIFSLMTSATTANDAASTSSVEIARGPVIVTVPPTVRVPPTVSRPGRAPDVQSMMRDRDTFESMLGSRQSTQPPTMSSYRGPMPQSYQLPVLRNQFPMFTDDSSWGPDLVTSEDFEIMQDLSGILGSPDSDIFELNLSTEFDLSEIKSSMSPEERDTQR